MAAKRGTGKRNKTTKKRASRRPVVGRNATEALLRKFVKELQERPEKYGELINALKAARTDKERDRLFLRFATSDHEIKSLLPPPYGSPHVYCYTRSLADWIMVW
jgi:hypothetical protein